MNRVKIGEICEFVSRGKTPDYDEYGEGFVVKSAQVFPDQIRWKDCPTVSSSFVSKYFQKFGLKHEDVLLNGTGTGTLGRPGFVNTIPLGKYIPDSHVNLLRANQTKVVPQFLFFWLLSSEGQALINKAYTGSTNQIELSADKVEELEIPLPPLEEQKRIAQVLDSADRLRRLRRHATQQTETFLQSVFIEMFGDVSTNSKSWQKVPAGELYEIQLGKMLDQKRITGQHLRPYLGNANVQWGYFNLGDVKYMDFDEKDFEKFKLRKGDILVCEGGEVGRTSIWNEEIPDCCYQKALHRLRAFDSQVLSEYFLFYMWFACKSRLLEDKTSQVSIAHFTAEKFKEFNVLLPPIELQQKFSQIYKVAKSAKNQHQEAERQAEMLFQSLLHRAFTGQLLQEAMAV